MIRPRNPGAACRRSGGSKLRGIRFRRRGDSATAVDLRCDDGNEDGGGSIDVGVVSGRDAVEALSVVMSGRCGGKGDILAPEKEEEEVEEEEPKKSCQRARMILAQNLHIDHIENDEMKVTDDGITRTFPTVEDEH